MIVTIKNSVQKAEFFIFRYPYHLPLSTNNDFQVFKDARKLKRRV
jgi:hypothetical protein